MFQKNKWKDSEKAIVVADFHSGANDSIKRGCYINESHKESSIPIGMSELHHYMDNKWKTVEKEHFDADYVLMLGDMIEGEDYPDDGIGCWTTDLDVQALNAAELFYAFEDAAVYGVQGSGFHSHRNPSLDKRVIDILGGHYQPKEYELPIGGVTFHMRHFAGYTRNKKTRASGLGEDLLRSDIDSDVYGNIDVFLRAHCHYMCGLLWPNPMRLAVICPGYKGRDAFVAHRSMDVPDCGHLIFEIVDGQYKWTSDVWRLPKSMLLPLAPKPNWDLVKNRKERIDIMRNKYSNEERNH
jgi:hypothetical protein